MTPPIDLNDPVAVLLKASEALAKAGIEHATYGALALAAYGEARETRDADLAVAGVTTEQARQALAGAGLSVGVAFDRMRFGGLTISRLTVFPGADDTGLNTVDLIEPRSERFASGVLKRSLSGVLRGRTVRIVSPEDYVILKILSTRERDLEDARSALRSVTNAAAVEAELASLTKELPDHDVAGRAAKVLTS